MVVVLRTGLIVWCCWLAVLATAVGQDGGGDRSAALQNAAASGSGPQLGGPRSVPGQISEDQSLRAQRQIPLRPTERWFRFKQQLQATHGLQLNIDESLFFQAASESPGRDEGASGLVRVYGQWAPSFAQGGSEFRDACVQSGEPTSHWVRGDAV